jgi:hypothetical protein
VITIHMDNRVVAEGKGEGSKGDDSLGEGG